MQSNEMHHTVTGERRQHLRGLPSRKMNQRILDLVENTTRVCLPLAALDEATAPGPHRYSVDLAQTLKT